MNTCLVIILCSVVSPPTITVNLHIIFPVLNKSSQILKTVEMVYKIHMQVLFSPYIIPFLAGANSLYEWLCVCVCMCVCKFLGDVALCHLLQLDSQNSITFKASLFTIKIDNFRKYHLVRANLPLVVLVFFVAYISYKRSARIQKLI